MVKTKNTELVNISITAAIITLILVPYISKDSMIIPKVILLFLLALYLIPKLVYDFKSYRKIPRIRFLLIILLLITIQLLISLLASDAPLEQQIYGQTGRGLGLITHLSLLIVTLSAAVYVRRSSLKPILIAIVGSGLVTSVYSILQSFGIDFLKWEVRTNGVIGTLGNPNFQSSFAAMVFIPAIFTFWNNRYRYLFSAVFTVIFIFTLVRTQSTQGYISLSLAICIFLMIYFWYKNKILVGLVGVSTLFGGVIAILGMLNYGPLSYYLYKVSVQSRGDFWRSAFAVSKDYPFTGVGIDSFGDYFLEYRDQIAASHTFAEYTNNAHNIFLEYSAVGGYPLSLLHLVFVIFVLLNFFTTQKKLAAFHLELTCLFSAWFVIQAQSIIAPQNISMILWNAIISGILIGYCVLISNSTEQVITNRDFQSITRPFSILLVVFGLIISYPLFNTDRLQMKAMVNGDGDLAILSAQKFPESSSRYVVISRALLDSGLPGPALNVARSAVEFNPNSANLWALLLINPAATIEEREKAKNEILKLDPLNKEVLNFKIR